MTAKKSCALFVFVIIYFVGVPDAVGSSECFADDSVSVFQRSVHVEFPAAHRQRILTLSQADLMETASLGAAQHADRRLAVGIGIAGAVAMVCIHLLIVAFRSSGGEALVSSQPPLDMKSVLKKERIGWYGKMFLKHRNPAFGELAELAFRGACVVSLYSLPFFLPKGIMPSFLYNWVETGVYTNLIGTQLLFAYKATVGGTMRAAVQLTSGTLYAALLIWIMFGFFPSGVESGGGRTLCFGIVVGLCFVLSMIWLNVPLNVTIFSLARFSVDFVAFLDPSADARALYSVGFTFQPTGKAVQAMTATLAGSILALTASLLPFPAFASAKAEEGCLEVIKALTDCWSILFEYANQDRKHEDTKSCLELDLFDIRRKLDDCDKNLLISSWECIGVTTFRHKRLKVIELSKFLRELYFQSLLAVGCISPGTYGPKHIDFMGLLPHSREVIQSAESLLPSIHRCICDGQADGLEKGILVMRDAVQALTSEFRSAKTAMSLSHVDVEYLDEHVYGLCLCMLGRMCCEFTSSCVNDLLDTQVVSTPVESYGIYDIFDFKVMMKRSHVSRATRRTLMYMLAFGIGIFGYHDVLSPFDPYIPYTVALLLTPGLRVDLTKNLDRLGGVVMGTAVGSLIERTFGYCVWWATLGSIACTFGLIMLTLFLHLRGTEYSYLCFIIAIFSQQQISIRCHQIGHGGRPLAEFNIVFSIVVAIFIMTMVDMLMPGDPASKVASVSIEAVWTKVTAAFDQAVDPAVSIRERGDEIAHLIAKASRHGAEAANEPRFWKTPWRKQSFEEAIMSLRLIRSCLRSIEGCRRCRTDDAVFLKALQLKPLRSAVKILNDKLNLDLAMMKAFQQERFGKLQELSGPDGGHIDTSFEEAISDFALEAGQLNMVSDMSVSLEFDCACRVNYIVACIDCVRVAARELRSSLIRNG